EQQEAAVAQKPDESVQQHVENLRHDVERVVKSPGAQLKSAPFHSASSLKSLAAGSQVVILVSTRYWYGVETESGEHGWVHHSQLEPLPCSWSSLPLFWPRTVVVPKMSLLRRWW